jgi:hypothetical protein
MNAEALQLSPTTPRKMARSVGAVLAGLVSTFAVTTATDVVLHASGIYPGWNARMSDGLFVLAAAYRVIYGILGSYVTARLSPDRPMRHALALGGIGVVLSIAGAFAMGDRGPAWYSLAVIAMSLPCAWAGARLDGARRAAR